MKKLCRGQVQQLRRGVQDEHVIGAGLFEQLDAVGQRGEPGLPG